MSVDTSIECNEGEMHEGPFRKDMSVDELKAAIKEIDPLFHSFITTGMAVAQVVGIELSHPYGRKGPVEDPAILCRIDDPPDKEGLVMIICHPDGQVALGMHNDADVEKFREFVKGLMGPAWFEAAMNDKDNPWGKYRDLPTEDKELEEFGIALPDWLTQLAEIEG